MDSGSALRRADDLEAVLVGPWVWPAWAWRFRIPFIVVEVIALALLPLTFSGITWVFGAVVIGTITAGLVICFALAMEAKSGTRLVGFSARGVFAPDLVPWDRVAKVGIGRATGSGRAVLVDGTDGASREVAVPATVTEPEYRAFAAALRTAATDRGVPVA